MLPVDHPLTIYQGDTRTFGIALERNEGTPEDPQLEPIDLTDCQARAQFRYRERGDLIASFDCEILDPPTQGQITVTLSHPEATKVDRDGVWDLEVISPDETVRTWIRGSVTAILEVTR